MQYSERTKRSHNNDHAKSDCFRALFRNRLAVDITPREIEDFRAWFGDGRAVATVNHYLKFVKAVFNRAIRQGRLSHINPVTPIKLAREHNARNRCLSPAEEARLLDAVPAWMRPSRSTPGCGWASYARCSARTWTRRPAASGFAATRPAMAGGWR